MARPIHRTSHRWERLNAAADGGFFLLATAASCWLFVVSLSNIHSFHWTVFAWLILLWATLAYLLLPRIHRVLTTLYVPDYFIGRARTTEGLLGDPVNLAFHGTEAQVEAAMHRAGWVKADPITLRTSLGIALSTLTRKSYPQAPVSPLLLFNRQQDLAFQQEVEGNPAQRHHIRFWQCPPAWPLPGGTRVGWLGAATYDKSVGLSLFTLQVTHKIAENTDQERDHVVQTLQDANPEVKVRVLADFSTAYHSRNGGGDSIKTDGALPIVDLRPVPASKPAEPTRLPSHLDDAKEFLRAERPIPIYVAMLLILLQIGGMVAWSVLALRDSGSYAGAVTKLLPDQGLLAAATPEQIVRTYVVSYLLGAAVFAGLAALMWDGFRPARLFLMAAATFTIVPAFVTWWRLGSSPEFDQYLLSVMMAVPLLMALTSPSVTEWADQRTDLRRARRTARKQVKAGSGK